MSARVLLYAHCISPSSNPSRTLAQAACTITQTTWDLAIFYRFKKKKISKFGRSCTLLRILVLICLLVFNHTSHIYGLRRWCAQISELGPIRSFHTCYLVSCAYDSVRRYLANDVFCLNTNIDYYLQAGRADLA